MRNDALALCTKNEVIIKYLCSICSVDKCPSVGYNIDTFRRGARKMTERKSFDFFCFDHAPQLRTDDPRPADCWFAGRASLL